MHDSSMRISRRHRDIRAVQTSQDDEGSLSNVTKRKRSKLIGHFKRHEGEGDSLEDEGGNIANFARASSVIDAGQPSDNLNGDEKLAVAPLEAQGETGLSITLVSQGKAVAPLPTGTPQALSPGPLSVTAAAGSPPGQQGGAGGTSGGHSGAPLEMSDVVWPIAVGVMFAVLVLVSCFSVLHRTACCSIKADS